jgi:hypothetical protein
MIGWAGVIISVIGALPEMFLSSFFGGLDKNLESDSKYS